MSKEFSELLKNEQSIGVMEIAKETFQAIAPGLSFSKILNDIVDTGKEKWMHGVHELGAGIVGGHAGFVMYPKAGQDQESQAIELLHQQKEAEGREM